MKLSILEATRVWLKKAVEIMNYGEDVYEILKDPQRVLYVRFPVKMDDGTIRIFTGIRAQHNDAVGPTKGGIRFHPIVDIDEVKALSIMCNIMCLPYGGGKGGVICDPEKMSKDELEGVSRGYVRAISQIVGPTKDIPAPDVFTNPQVMAWMMDEYSKIREYDSPGFITGKPISLGGSLGRASATSKGCSITMDEAAKKIGLDISKSTIAIQGCGNVGSYMVKFAEEMGAKIVAVCDVKGGLYCPNGISYEKIRKEMETCGTIRNLEDCERIAPKDVLTIDCDILIPAAIENVISMDNVHDIKAKLIIEAANGPTTPEAHTILQDKGVLIVPDILANAGGVTVSYFEWVQNNEGYYWSEDEIHEKLELKMRLAFNRIWDIAQEKKVDLRLAAHLAGIERVVEAMRLRGWVR